MTALQTQNDPAAIAVAPGHGSINPQKDTKMNKAVNTTALAGKKATDEEVAYAMRSLEGAVRELMHMAEITADIFDETFGSSNRVTAKDGKSVTYEVTIREDDQMSFLVNNVASRCNRLMKQFDAAWNGVCAE